MQWVVGGIERMKGGERFCVEKRSTESENFRIYKCEKLKGDELFGLLMVWAEDEVERGKRRILGMDRNDK